MFQGIIICQSLKEANNIRLMNNEVNILYRVLKRLSHFRVMSSKIKSFHSQNKKKTLLLNTLKPKKNCKFLNQEYWKEYLEFKSELWIIKGVEFIFIAGVTWFKTKLK